MNEDDELFDHSGSMLNVLYVDQLKETIETIHFLFQMRNSNSIFLFNVECSKS